MKLKTLEDIKQLYDTENGIHWVDNTELRQEAIKWIKYNENEKGYYDENVFVNRWIKDFFNLTEDDLK